MKLISLVLRNGIILYKTQVRVLSVPRGWVRMILRCLGVMIVNNGITLSSATNVLSAVITKAIDTARYRFQDAVIAEILSLPARKAFVLSIPRNQRQSKYHKK